MECDYYKLYLAIDYQYRDRIICETLDQVEYELNRASGYNEYLIIGHNNAMDCDTIIAHDYIQVNRTHTRKGR